jgi:lipopolysaccharide export system protein LptC
VDTGMTDPRKLVFGLLLATIAVGSWWLTRSVTPPPAADPQTHSDPDYIIEKFDARAMNEHGTRKYDLSAARLAHYPNDDTSHLTQPRLVQYPLHGAPIVTTADSGIMPGNGREIFMNGNVRVIRTSDKNRPGGEMQADHLRIELDRDRAR